MFEPESAELAPAPVFVDRSGARGRLLRGFGWPVSVVGAVMAAAMGSSLIGVQAAAPVMGIPAQPSLSPTPSPSPSPSPAPSLSPTPSPSSSSHRPTTGSATAHAKRSATTPGTATTATHGATHSGQPTKHA